jgi:4-hydroxy-2-oxoheptanedioate aldolase
MRSRAVVARKRVGLASIVAVLAALAAVGVLASRVSAQQPLGGPRMHLNHVIDQFEQGRPAVAEEDWVFFTLTNTPFNLPDLQKLLANLRVEGARPKMAPIVRIAQWGGGEYEHVVKQLLSVGAMGIIVPEVHSKDQVRKLTKAMRYPPQRTGYFTAPPVGVRGCCPGDAPKYWGLTLHDYFVQSDLWWPGHPNGNLLAIVMVESREAINNIDGILSEPGLGGVLIGPHDLSMDLGVGEPESNPGAPEVEDATAKVAKSCVAHKALCGTFSTTQSFEARLKQGFKLFPLQRKAYGAR